MEKMDTEEEDIFGDLLGKQRQTSTSPKCQKLQSSLDDDILHCHKSIQPESDSEAKSSPILSYLNSKCKTVLAHCEDEKFCYVLLDKCNLVRVQVYMLPLHETSSGTSHPELYHSFNTSLSSSLFQDEIHHISKSPSLYVLRQAPSHSDTQKTSFSTTNWKQVADITLQKHLFVYLFGQETACLRSPVLMLCTNKGDMLSYTMESPNHGRLQLFCSVSGLVVSLTPVVIGKEKPEDEQDRAKSRLIDSIKSSLGAKLGNAGDMKESSLDGLLVVGYSGLCLEICQLLLCKREKQYCVSHTSRTLLPHANIRDLRLHNLGRHGGNDEGCHLAGITSEHDMVNIAALKRSTSSEGPSGQLEFIDDLELGSKDDPASLRDTLHRLRSHTEAIKTLQAKSTQLDSVLQQLNLFATLSQQQRTSNFNSNLRDGQGKRAMEDSILDCHCHLVCPDKEHLGAWKVKLTLCNKSAVPFSDKWSIVVYEDPILRYTGDTSMNSSNNSYVNCFQFHLHNGLEAKSDMAFVVPVLDSEMFDHLLELRISVSMVLSVVSPCRARSLSPGGSQNSTHRLMQIEICKQSFDILHFLRISSSRGRKERCLSYDNTQVETEIWLRQQLKKMAVNRFGDCIKSSENSDVKTQTSSLTISLPHSYVAEKQISKSCEVLESLLHPTAMGIKESSSSFTSPGSQTVSLSVEVCDTKDGSLPIQNRSFYCLRMKCCDVLMIYVLFEAVMKRMEFKTSKEDQNLSKENLEYALQSMKRTRSDLVEDLRGIKFGSQSHEDCWSSFCNFLHKLSSLRALEQTAV